MNIIIMGAPGAGKGTQSEIISERYEIPSVSTGAILRAEIAAGTELGKKAQAVVESGGLVSDELMSNMIKSRLGEPDCAGGYILDGFPRTINQAKVLDEMGVNIDCVLYMDVSDEVIIDRLSGRRMCGKCGAGYHIRYSPSKAGETLCEQCGGELVIRKDDKTETIKNRLATFHEQTVPVVKYYEDKGLLCKVEGHGTVEQITEKTLRALEELQ